MTAIPERSLATDPLREPLLLVADELAVTLNEARAALEQYAEGEVGNQPLERCTALLHTARGVLQVTETWGGGLFGPDESTFSQTILLAKDPPDAWHIRVAPWPYFDCRPGG